jgi:UDP-N-acetylglucosamine--N-acetylmuramyl-(pentapeptide) pyrophosphoryl-undecaprenol N-acetylglucosamine transferase
MSKTICITGGGTGGHLSVARTLIDEFYSRDYEVFYVGSTKGADREWFSDYPKIKKAYFLDTKGVVNQNFLGKFVSLFQILKQTFFCIKIFKEHNINQIISVGGFSAASASFGAILSRRQLFIHEQNSVMGSLNKLTSKKATEIFSSYDKKATIKDYPIDEKFFKYQRVRTEINSIIFLGGSQGAKAINNLALTLAPRLDEMGIKIIHQTGRNDFKRIQQEYHKLGIKCEVFDFSKDILEFMNKADFAISRSGASTLWELCALGLPTLFIPYPYAAADHQYYNAKFLSDKNLAFVKRENELENVLEQIKNPNLQTISEGLIKQINKDGVKKIVDKIVSYQNIKENNHV